MAKISMLPIADTPGGDDSFPMLQDGHVKRVEYLALLTAIAEKIGPAGQYIAMSTSSLTIGTGPRTLVIDSGKMFGIGQAIVIASRASPLNIMSGRITAHDPVIGALTVNVLSSEGEGTFDDWSIALLPNNDMDAVYASIAAQIAGDFAAIGHDHSIGDIAGLAAALAAIDDALENFSGDAATLGGQNGAYYRDLANSTGNPTHLITLPGGIGIRFAAAEVDPTQNGQIVFGGAGWRGRTSQGQVFEFSLRERAENLPNKTLVSPTINGDVSGTGIATSLATSQSNRLVLQSVVKARIDEVAALALGVGQTWQDVTGTRIAGTTYQNTTGRPIQIAVTAFAASNLMEVSANNSTWITVGSGGTAGGGLNTSCSVIPNGHYYRFIGNSISFWAELRS